jgi:hypothetical protein
VMSGHGPDIDPTSTLVVGIERGLARPAGEDIAQISPASPV